MAAIRATHCKIGTILESGRPHKHVCRSIRTVRSSHTKEVRNEDGPSSVKIDREKLRVDQGKVGVAAVETDGQTIAQWDKLRDTVSGLRASVGSMSLSWKTENGKGEKSSDIQNERDRKDRNIRTKAEVVIETLKQEGTQGTHVKTENKEHLNTNKEGETLSSEHNAKWVEQILEMQEEQSKDTAELDNDLNIQTENTSTMSKEKLDDPFAETNTEAAKRKTGAAVSSSLASRINFKYFSKANKVKHASNQQNVEKLKEPAQEQNSTSASTIDRIKDAVGFSAATATQKDINNSASADNLNTTKATIVDTIEDKAASKNTNGTDVDKSYWNVLSNLPQNVLLNLSLTSAPKPGAETPEQIARNIMHNELESESTFSVRTSSLADNLVAAESNMSKVKRLGELCIHLTQHPQFRHIAVQHKVLPCLLKLRECGNPKIMAKANEALALVGYIVPPQGRGIKMLSIDGGGTRGLIAIEILQRLERLCNQPVNQMFDFVIGSSTGALLASLIFILKIPLHECKELYLDRSAKMFVKESMLKMTRNMTFHDAAIFEEILKAECGETTLMHTAMDPSTPKMAITSTLVKNPTWKTFMFRNYNHPPGVISDYQGSCNLKMWEAIRASGAAPFYYSPFQIGEHVFRDGGCLINNPTAAGIHECKLLWPHESFQCVLSLGNGRYDPNLDKEEVKGYAMIPKVLKDLPGGFIDSATDTEGIHMVLKNTLDSSYYFRLSPYLRENYDLNTVQPEKIKAMLGEADDYMERNELCMQKVVTQLKQDRLPNQKIMDYTNRRRQTHDYLLFNLDTFRTGRKMV